MGRFASRCHCQDVSYQGMSVFCKSFSGVQRDDLEKDEYQEGRIGTFTQACECER